jgi:hypothetical protein
MITGFNTDVEHDGQVYHVQTEDKGLVNPIIETLVYTGGQIVSVRKSSYAELAAAGRCDDAQIQRRMEQQHLGLIHELREGMLSKEDLQPFGWNVVSNRGFDQVVLSFLEERVPVEKLRIELIEPHGLRAGASARLELRVTEESTERPIGRASVVVRLCRGDATTDLVSARTDASGRVAAPCAIPVDAAAGTTIVCAAEAAGKTAEVICPIRGSARRSVSRA